MLTGHIMPVNILLYRQEDTVFSVENELVLIRGVIIMLGDFIEQQESKFITALVLIY